MGDLPQFILMKPVSLKAYVCYERGTELGHVYCRGSSVFEPYAKIEIERAKTSENLFHLRFCHSNRYLGRCPHDEWAIAAVSKHPEEDQLFKLSVDEKGGSMTMYHFKSGFTVFTENTRLSLGCTRNDTQRFNYVDWDEFVRIPQHVMFKGYNDKFLRATWFEDHPYLRFDGLDDSTDPQAVQVVSPHWDGHLRIKSAYFGRFWRRGPDSWICGDSNDDSGADKDTLFMPKKYGEDTVVLRNEGNKENVMGIAPNCLLKAATQFVTTETKLVVKEIWVERSIYDVKYHLDDARVFDHAPYSVASTSAENYEDEEATLTLEAEADITTSNTFTDSYSFHSGAEVNFTMGIPFIANGDEIKVSAEGPNPRAWGQEKTNTRHVSSHFSIRVPPKTRATATYVATKARCTVPFSYTQDARSPIDGHCVTTHHTDGIFSALDCYGFRFEALKFDPL